MDVFGVVEFVIVDARLGLLGTLHRHPSLTQVVHIADSSLRFFFDPDLMPALVGDRREYFLFVGEAEIDVRDQTLRHAHLSGSIIVLGYQLGMQDMLGWCFVLVVQ